MNMALAVRYSTALPHSPADAFDKFPETCTSEVHLATEFQNMIYESSVFPKRF